MIYLQVFTSMRACKRAHTHIHTHIYTYVYIERERYIYIYISRAQTEIYAYIHIHSFIYIHVCMNACMCVYEEELVATQSPVQTTFAAQGQPNVIKASAACCRVNPSLLTSQVWGLCALGF